MKQIAISIKNLSKQYRLGVVGTGTVSHDLNRWWKTVVLGKEDPYLKIGEKNEQSKKGQSDYVWALRNIDLEIAEGDVVGIIGKNGAGKSTLLKILSRVTKPTEGTVSYNGRIASLLEVGTGFHPEMTGRENIYMNGAIMGMRKSEITRKFDEIVSFSGIERYVDTPVKRYSSGMTVRLGFSVAAHLEPDILVVDEVLAVGDAEFQKKAIGKMKNVSWEKGRTVLFVSHNMTAVKSFCTSAILLESGQIAKSGNTDEVIASYLSHYSNHILFLEWNDNFKYKTDFAALKSIRVIPENSPDTINAGESFTVEMEFLLFEGGDFTVDPAFQLFDEAGNMVFDVSSSETDVHLVNPEKGLYKWKCIVPANLMMEGSYTIGRIMLVKNFGFLLLDGYDVLTFEIVSNEKKFGWMGQKLGIVKPLTIWSIINNKRCL
ncbi:MAG: hypothetical protein A2W91_12275 [Bacteroidetes bacterium GWF2_38_335]|nr:MAG: hypothetical protein A2W91_12275 [Bacteroidetes bacterium GWF2_38_335]OFY76947.1 MAG: hypothetical protein A2281_00390 [Bacteroidetes bacterium RIFOXYA12_FULL_38_20]HBS86799.1 ABC transporter [Bacteroidales bacterium]